MIDSIVSWAKISPQSLNFLLGSGVQAGGWFQSESGE
jgi:hypothetical protein